ncbi:PREDICTED: L-idonate 5-dehydrogenase-like isoform X1 [Nicotiana attenuata]|uniref:L-idonate 5-dehydrogenase n=1 Tax=Nicotiana attenuata TaxID=49451 RepID=A0A1J6IGJ6_NICAT|nr:PREDICTED: L-idonate 5-dehydrogenase-like isoform X1 [Nicotiana attenuata]OIT03770.1 l-idonate 5-dehydrogenase [Nicotiana attenuata]
MVIKEHISTDDAENSITEEENMAVWLLGIKTLRIQPYSLPPLGPYDVKIQIKAVGICGSDIHHFKNMRVANFVVKRPMVLGHECAGIVEQVGSQVKSLMIGDRVALEPGISCRQCHLCKDGRYNLCRQMKFFGSPPTNGALANQVVHPADLCFKLPDNVSLEEGAMCEPLSVGVHACRRAKVGPETKIIIIGAGPIGLVTMLAARAFGSPKIVIVDIDDQRLSFAKDLGADEIIKVSSNVQDVEDEVGHICNAMGGPVDMSFDCVGFNKTMLMTLQTTHPGGKVCLVGLGQSEMTLPLTSAAAREVDVIGIFRYRNTWPLCIELLRTGKIDVKPLITHRYRFTQEGVEEAFETSSRGGNAINVMFKL